ncbi:MAG: ABC transporter permease [Dehalococcoidia bacterium]|nr:ABC transporter permease [Dehalococcoidia bacterium]
MTATTLPEARVAARSARFSDTLASEWAKIFSARSTYVTLLLGLGLSLGMTALVSLAVGSTFEEWTASDQATFEPIMFSLVGIVFGGIVYSVFGVLVGSAEYSSGMIRLTLTATPKRGRVLAAKALLVTVVVGVFSLLSTVGMFFLGQAILGSYDMPTASLSDLDAQRAVFGTGLTGAFFPLIGLSLAFLLRSTAGAITAVLGVLWLPEIFGGLLPNWWRENVLSLLPGPALDSAVIGHIVDSSMYPDPVVGGLMAAGWLVLALGSAFVLLVRRDA